MDEVGLDEGFWWMWSDLESFEERVNPRHTLVDTLDKAEYDQQEDIREENDTYLAGGWVPGSSFSVGNSVKPFFNT